MTMLNMKEAVVLEAQENNNIYIPVNKKINLTIHEAVAYSNIGETTIRKLLHEKACPFLLKVGNKNLIKRKEFEKYIESKHYI